MNATRRSTRVTKISALGQESANYERMAKTPKTQQAGVEKASGRPKKTATGAKPAKATSKKTTAKAPAKLGRKRKAASNDSNAVAPQSVKKARVAKTPAPKAPKAKININSPPIEALDVYVFGEGSNSELGLGTAKISIDVKRPRLNHLLDADIVGVILLACGGMHTLALTRDNKVLSWGANDNGALGRDTAWEGGLRDIEDDQSDTSDDDSKLNPYESTPTAVTGFAEGTIITKVAAGDSVSLALTNDGLVYGWGTFRNQSGVLGFYQDPTKINRRAGNASGEGLINIQTTPRLYTEMAKIVDIVCGSNHCIALSQNGQIYIWGCGEQNQLGHHINERLDVEGKACLVPSLLRTGRRKYAAIYTGADHAFAVDTNNNVYAWGLNSFGATGISKGAGEDAASVFVPTLVEKLSDNPDDPVKFMCGGQHHSMAITQSGSLLVFGRLDGLQTGLDINTLPSASIIYDENHPPRPRILIIPTAVPGIGTARFASAGTDHSIVINTEGKAWSWGISATYQTGQGTTDDIKIPTMIDNTAVHGEQLTWSGCGGQYSMLAGPAAIEDELAGRGRR